MPKADHDYTPSRRRLLGHLIGGTAAAVITVDPKQSLAAGPASELHGGGNIAPTPIAALYARYVVAAADLKRVDRQCDEVKKEIIARCGDTKRGQLRSELWSSDPAYPEFERLCDASNDAFDHLCDLLDKVEESQAQSAEDVVFKLRVVIAEWEDDHPDDLSRLHVHVMRDAERFLSAGGMA